MFGKGPPSVRSGKEKSSFAAQRRFARATVDLEAEFTSLGAAAERDARIGDLSGGGLRLMTDRDLPAGSIIAVRFTLGMREIRVQGRVVLSYFDANVNRFGHGVAFTAIEPGARDAIAEFVTGD
jgi:c-di-GMP-binding flagellar brake protein YcgR